MEKCVSRLIERRGELPTSIFSLLDKKDNDAKQLDDLLQEEMLVTLVGELQIQWRQHGDALDFIGNQVVVPHIKDLAEDNRHGRK